MVKKNEYSFAIVGFVESGRRTEPVEVDESK